jgi:hypothetical protein
MELVFVPLAGKGVGPLQRTQVNVLKIAAGDGMQGFEFGHVLSVQAGVLPGVMVMCQGILPYRSSPRPASSSAD